MRRGIVIMIGFFFLYIGAFLYLRTLIDYQPYFHYIAVGTIVALILVIYLAGGKERKNGKRQN